METTLLVSICLVGKKSCSRLISLAPTCEEVMHQQKRSRPFLVLILNTTKSVSRR